jgi:alpha-tubulin suppressor-like RCC1 family protein
MRITSLAVIVALSACSSASELTEVVVVVGTDLGPDEVNWVDLAVLPPPEAGSRQESGMEFPADRSPLAWGLVYRGGPLGPMTVQAKGRPSQGAVAAMGRAAIFSFVPNEVRVLRLDLLESCLGVTCPGGQTCGDNGMCRSTTVDAAEMARWDGTIHPIGWTPQDAGVDGADTGTDAADTGTDAADTGVDGDGQDASSDALEADVEDSGSDARDAEPDGPYESEVCGNSTDDNLNGLIDEYLQSGSDRNNCGFCGITCSGDCVSRACPDDLVEIAAGTSHSCALRANGRVFCWGDNEHNQLGSPSKTDTSHVMTLAALGGEARSVAAGARHTCALLSSGGVVCWGDNARGQLGDSSTSDFSPRAVGIDKARAVVTGSSHSCALLETDDEVFCWGANDLSQTGHNGTAPAGVEKGKGTLKDVAILAAGGDHTCAAQYGDKGRLLCWGDNARLQSGQPDSDPEATEAKKVGDFDGRDFTHLACGRWHSCGVHSTDGVLCWGSNEYGQLGRGTTGADQQLPQPAKLSDGVEWLTAGRNHSCAILANGRAVCWGRNNSHQLGLGMDTGAVPTPQFVAGPPHLVHSRLAGGHSHTCSRALGHSDWPVYCWGANADGQLNPAKAAQNFSLPLAAPVP